jgi:hypothetical protein
MSTYIMYVRSRLCGHCDGAIAIVIYPLPLSYSRRIIATGSLKSFSHGHRASDHTVTDHKIFGHIAIDHMAMEHKSSFAA